MKQAIGRHPAGPMETLYQRILDAEKRRRQQQLETQKDKKQTDLTIEGKTDSAPTTTETTATEELKIDSQPTGQSWVINRNPEGPMETLMDRIRQSEEKRRRRSGGKGGKKDSGTGKGAGGPNTGNAAGTGAGEANL
mgnify:CR=1 FL=1|tara:strand:+ start:56 stop:466 length:411 start_codon:yes stop_codon:yes gene_type:complete